MARTGGLRPPCLVRSILENGVELPTNQGESLKNGFDVLLAHRTLGESKAGNLEEKSWPSHRKTGEL
jgi:hypothetical protein